jgi:hypothetical protein
MNPPSVTHIIRETITDTIARRRDVTLLAATQRSKFEDWLKWEVAASLSKNPSIENVRLEDGFERHRGKCDLSFHASNSKWYVELKTSNTNWRAGDLENRIRPITANIALIVADIVKLRKQCGRSKGIAAFVLFPIPIRIWEREREKLSYHLRRIEREGKLPENALEDSEFVSLHREYGMGVFVVAVV